MVQRATLNTLLIGAGASIVHAFPHPQWFGPQPSSFPKYSFGGYPYPTEPRKLLFWSRGELKHRWASEFLELRRQRSSNGYWSFLSHRHWYWHRLFQCTIRYRVVGLSELPKKLRQRPSCFRSVNCSKRIFCSQWISRRKRINYRKWICCCQWIRRSQ